MHTNTLISENKVRSSHGDAMQLRSESVNILTSCGFSAELLSEDDNNYVFSLVF